MPKDGKLEARVFGPNVTPGYWRQAGLTRAAFDEEGFFRLGDALTFVDPQHPEHGLLFDGRIAEDFKLTTGTWVHVGGLRVGVLAAASPALQDAVVAGENRDFIGLLAWLNVAGCQKLIGAGAPSSPAELANHPAVREHIRASLARWNATHSGASQHIGRVLILADPPSIDANEITDKGYINQRLALERRRADVERLFAAAPDPAVLIVDA